MWVHTVASLISAQATLKFSMLHARLDVVIIGVVLSEVWGIWPYIVLCPDSWEVRVWRIWTVTLVWLALSMHTDTAVLKQISDLIGQQGCVGASQQFNLYNKQWCLWLVKHIIVLNLKSDWIAQIPSLTQGLCPYSPDPLRVWRLGPYCIVIKIMLIQAGRNFLKTWLPWACA